MKSINIGNTFLIGVKTVVLVLILENSRLLFDTHHFINSANSLLAVLAPVIKVFFIFF